MQNIWKSGINWDDKLTERDYNCWIVWLDELKLISQCKIPRCYKLNNTNINETELYVFCDASENAYAAVAYSRFKLKNGSFHTSIIIAKSRVAPLKPITIPRLELQAAVLGVRLAQVVAQEHSLYFERRVFWSDSQTVLQWLKIDPRTYKTYVMNRLGEICEETDVKEWP